MPPFNGNTYPPYATMLTAGDAFALFNAEAVVTGESSVVIAVSRSGPITIQQITFQQLWSTAPTATVVLYGSNIAPTAAGPQTNQGILVATFTSAQDAHYTDVNSYSFYWAVVTSYTAGGLLSLLVQL